MFLITVLKGFRIISNLYLIINVIISFKIHLTPLTQIHKPKAFSFHRKISFNKCYYWLQVFVFIVTLWHDQIYEYNDINNNKKMSTHDAIMANNNSKNLKKKKFIWMKKNPKKNNQYFFSSTTIDFKRKKNLKIKTIFFCSTNVWFNRYHKTFKNLLPQNTKDVAYKYRFLLLLLSPQIIKGGCYKISLINLLHTYPATLCCMSASKCICFYYSAICGF